MSFVSVVVCSMLFNDGRMFAEFVWQGGIVLDVFLFCWSVLEVLFQLL